MPKENKKELIIQKALKLFSEKGFAAVSMRDLAESVGISVSTIYHYYPSKQDLAQDMIARANELTAKARDSFFRILSGTEESERFHEPAAEEAWQKMMFTDPIMHEVKVFELLAARGEIRETDADRLAGEYHGIVMLGYFTGDTDRMARELTAFYNRVFNR